MKIIIANHSGFCGGVLNTINKTQKVLENDIAYIKGEIVHNEYVINKLKNKGLITVNSLDEVKENNNVIIRAHGESKEFYNKASKMKIKLIDLTCPKVKKIHDLNLEHNNYFVVIIGKKNHPEVLGHISYAKDFLVIEKESDIEELINKVNNDKIYILAQTTFNEQLFDELVKIIKEKCQNISIEVNNTICNVTRIRQREIRELSKKVDKMIIIGSMKSSNTMELYEVARENCHNVYIIQDINNLEQIILDNNDIVGIAAGASTPKELIYEVKTYLQK